MHNAYDTYVCKIPKCLRVHNLFLLPSECSIRAFQVHILFQLMSYSVFLQLYFSKWDYLLVKKITIQHILPSVAHLNPVSGEKHQDGKPNRAANRIQVGTWFKLFTLGWFRGQVSEESSFLEAQSLGHSLCSRRNASWRRVP